MSEISAVVGPASIVRRNVFAACDLGSNSVHLLVGVVRDHEIEPLADESAFLGLGATVDRHGILPPTERGVLLATLVRNAETARRLGADGVVFIGTEPLRRMRDADQLAIEIEQLTGSRLHVLSHEEEGFLTFLGATEAHPVDEETAVVDIGGGSTELIVVAPDRPAVTHGLRIGSGRLSARVVEHDPATMAEVEQMRAEAAAALEGLPELRPRELIAVGGTASNLIKAVPAAALDRVLDRGRIDAALAALVSEPAELAAQRFRLNPARARVLPAGAAILEAILDRCDLEEMLISPYGVREGALLAAARLGMGRWRDCLPSLMTGWSD